MKQKGRKSAAKMSVVTPLTVQRPKPPDDLLPHERELWEKITATKTVEWFDAGIIPLLAEYCRLKTSIDLMAEQIEDFDPEWFNGEDGIKRYKMLSDIRDKAQGRMVSLARSMRLTNQSRFQPLTASTRTSTKKAGARIWERD